MARATRELADPTRVPAWSREESEAWVMDRVGINLSGESWTMTERQLRMRRVARRHLLRLCPEATDYQALVDRFGRAAFVTLFWADTATDDEVRAYVEQCVAALWHQSLSEPSDGEAREEGSGG